jgi:hypothetical protein|tara:strand:- start:1238 stop:1609 length:372 start_codon:yes stop_codon:yes gene_type:complete
MTTKQSQPTPVYPHPVQVCMSTTLVANKGIHEAIAIEDRARTLGEAISEYYDCSGKMVTITVDQNISNWGAPSGRQSEWFRVSYLGGREKQCLVSKRGNLNDYAGMKSLWRDYENGRLFERLR